MAIRGRTYVNHPLTRRFNLLFFPAATVDITVTVGVTRGNWTIDPTRNDGLTVAATRKDRGD